MKIKSIKPEDFFKLLSIHSGVSDLSTVRDIYFGMIKTISRELKEKEIIRLPDWGEFKLKTHKERIAVDVNDGNKRMLPPKTVVKFTPDYKVKKYFYEWGKQ